MDATITTTVEQKTFKRGRDEQADHEARFKFSSYTAIGRETERLAFELLTIAAMIDPNKYEQVAHAASVHVKIRRAETWEECNQLLDECNKLVQELKI